MAKVIERSGDAVAAFFDDGHDVVMVNTNCHCAYYNPLHQKVQKNIPELYTVDQQTFPMKPERKLGGYTTYSYGDLTDEFPIAVNLYSQLYYGIGERHLNYAALTCSLLNVCGFILDGVDTQRTVRVCLSRTGLEYEGGDWEIIKEILEFCPERVEFYVYSS
tara:strand:+ start:254 stop:739 length:486 start_codon:yes stop_codon:yes gene_type:complete